MTNDERIIALLADISRKLSKLTGDTGEQTQSEPPRLPFNQLLKTRMEENGLTQTGLARATGINKASISGYFSGKHIPKPEQLEKIVAVLGCTLEEFNKTRPTKVGMGEAVKLKKITVAELAKRIGKAPQSVRCALVSGEAAYGRAYKKKNGKYGYEIYPAKVRELWGIDFLSEWRDSEIMEG
jgi:DNA-binding XRE family transcriptional regulator